LGPYRHPEVIAGISLIAAKGGKAAEVDIGSILGYILVGIVVGGSPACWFPVGVGSGSSARSSSG
jgi:hypothetical protein